MQSRNAETWRTRAYREATVHSPRSVRTSTHRLDWDTKPLPFKIYPDLPAVPLPRDVPAPALDALAALAGRAGTAAPLDLGRLAALLFYSAGVTRTQTYPSGLTMHFRA